MSTTTITSSQQLEKAIQSLSKSDFLGFDTEFIRETTFVPELCLFQITDGNHIFLIDVLAVPDLSPLEELLLDPRPLKVLHSGDQDLEILYRRTGQFPENLFDTQIGAALVGLGDHIALAGLVRKLLGQKIPKGQTRSDWKRRPLTPQQLEYAAADVAPLAPLYQALHKRLKKHDRLEWAFEETARLADPQRFDPSPEHRLRTFRKAWKLSGKELSVLRDLIEWREAQARIQNLPRNRISTDSTLLALAQRAPRTMKDFQGYRDIPNNLVKRSGSEILDVIQQAMQRPRSEWPASPVPPQTDPSLASIVDLLSAYLRLRAADLMIAPALLASRKTLEEVARSCPRSLADVEKIPALRGWRAQALGEDLVHVFHGKLSIPVDPDSKPDNPRLTLIQPPSNKPGSSSGT